MKSTILCWCSNVTTAVGVRVSQADCECGSWGTVMSHSLKSGRCGCECNRYVCALEFLKRSRSVSNIKANSRCVHLLKATFSLFFHFLSQLIHHVIFFPIMRNIGNDVRSESDMSLISFSVTVLCVCVCVSTFRHLRQFNPSGNVTAALVKGVD